MLSKPKQDIKLFQNRQEKGSKSLKLDEKHILISYVGAYFYFRVILGVKKVLQ